MSAGASRGLLLLLKAGGQAAGEEEPGSREIQLSLGPWPGGLHVERASQAGSPPETAQLTRPHVRADPEVPGRRVERKVFK